MGRRHSLKAARLKPSCCSSEGSQMLWPLLPVAVSTRKHKGNSFSTVLTQVSSGSDGRGNSDTEALS